ncbi:MAG: nucleoside triphosphate pyrophosphohydrolase [Spirochaetaceae bacterium]
MSTNENGQNNRGKEPGSGDSESAPGRIPAPPYEKATVSETGRAFDYFYEIIALLMGPKGCPWDREQTPESMRRHILEEAFELIEAIDNQDEPHMDEEIGDLFLVVSMVLRMRELYGNGSAPAVFDQISEKLIRRHPHVFAQASAEDSRSVKAQWEAIKRDVEGKLPAESLDEEHQGFPPLARAYKLQKKAAKQGFDWPSAEPVIDKVEEELAEIKEVLRDASKLEEEVGDLLFSVVNLARKLEIDPSLALRRSTAKFARRFDQVKELATERGMVMEETPLEELDRLWEYAKRTNELE